MSFKKTLMTTTVLFALVPIVLISLIFVFVARNNIVNIEKDTLKALTISNGSALNEILVSQAREITLMSNNTAVKYYVDNHDTISSASINNTKSALSETIELWVSSYDEFEDALFVNKDGYIVASYVEDNIGQYVGDKESFLDSIYNYENGIINKTLISDKVESSTNKGNYSIVMSNQIIDSSGELVGIMALHLSVGYFKNFIDSLSNEESRIPYIVDGYNKVIFHPKDNNVNSEITSDILLKNFEKIRSGEKGNYNFITYTENGVKYSCAIYLIKEANWILVVSKPWDDVLQPLHFVVAIILISSLLAMIIAIFVSNVISKHFMQPITNLKNAFSSVQKENIYIPCSVSTNNEFGQLAEGYNAMIEQLSNNEKENHYLAYKDRITKLNNNFAIRKILSETIELEKPFAVLFLDLDDFKMVNDLFGYKSGNDILIEVSKIIKDTGDIPKKIGRYGGDEFLIIVEGGENQVTNYALDIIEKLKEPIDISNASYKISSSIGIAFYPSNGKTEELLIKNAEIAMYEAKEAGKNTLVIFNQMIENKIIRANKIISILKNCIVNEEIYPVFQPEVDFKTNKILGFEALMRINSKEIGFISPAEFIPIAESGGFINEMGYWMLEKSCEFFKKLIDDGYDLEFISVNLSPVQIMDANFVNYIVKILEKTNLDFRYLQVEVTESLIIKNMDSCISQLLKLRKLGATVALDDFGTSYSSLNYLINLPIDTIKIDKSFVDDICDENKKLVIVRSIVHMAHNIGLNVVTEGVETSMQRDLLQEENCDILQGYFYSKPLEEKDVITLLNANSKNKI